MEVKKIYYSISEVSELTGVEISTLRFWEKEIAQLDPPKTKGGTRRYREEDIDVVRQIKFLTETCLYTLEGVRKCLDTKQEKVGHIEKAVAHLQKARAELIKIRLEMNEIGAMQEEIIVDNPDNAH